MTQGSPKAKGARRHHFVPRWYLQRFAREDSVLVRWRDAKPFVTNTLNVAVESGFYDLSDAQGDKSLTAEDALAKIDGAAADTVRLLDATGQPPDQSSPERARLSAYLAFQLSRTPEQRERVLFPKMVAEYAHGQEVTREVVTEYLVRVHLGRRPKDSEAWAAFDYVTLALSEPAALSPEFSIAMMFKTVEAASPLLTAMNWTLEFDRKDSLVTSDTPLVLWRAPTPRDQYEGVGIKNAEELRFPLDPSKQLVLSRRRRTPTVRITAEEARRYNADMASACYQFVVGHPDQRKSIEALPLGARRPALRFNTGPLREVQPDGTTRYKGEVLHMWVPRREAGRPGRVRRAGR